MTQIPIGGNWGRVASELEHEVLKLKSYDGPLLQRLGDVEGKEILDYGCGPGVLLSVLRGAGANAKGWDRNKRMRSSAGRKAGHENVYQSLDEIPRNHFDYLVCNLVACINWDGEVLDTAKDIQAFLKDGGEAYVGFCNPLIYDVRESQLDIRHPSGKPYKTNHTYKKTKKEGGYQITERHRPIEWYEGIFTEAGLQAVGRIFTPEYEFSGNMINDFLILRLKKQK